MPPFDGHRRRDNDATAFLWILDKSLGPAPLVFRGDGVIPGEEAEGRVFAPPSPGARKAPDGTAAVSRHQRVKVPATFVGPTRHRGHVVQS